MFNSHMAINYGRNRVYNTGPRSSFHFCLSKFCIEIIPKASKIVWKSVQLFHQSGGIYPERLWILTPGINVANILVKTVLRKKLIRFI